MAIIKSLYSIYNKSTMTNDCVSKIRSCKELEEIKEYFCIDKECAIIAATFICKRLEDPFTAYFTIESLEEEWDMGLAQIASLVPSLDILLQKQILLLRNKQPYKAGTASRSTSFIVDDTLIDLLCYNKPFKEYEAEYDLEFKFDVHSFFSEVAIAHKRLLTTKYSFNDFIRPYREDKWIKDMLLDIDKLEPESQTVNLSDDLKFFLVAIKYLSNDTKVNVIDICNYCGFTPNKTVSFLKSFKDESFIAVRKGYLKLEKSEISENAAFVWGQKVIEAFEGCEDLLLLDFKSNELNKIANKDIKEKQLFYNESNQKDVDRLSNILEENKYQELKERLEEKNLPKGLTILLYGSPGTGKTETVMQLAKKTGRDVFHLNIEEVKSCWVGESEKNVKKIFKAYYASKAKIKPILLFNEADAIISKRTTVSGSNSAVTKMENTIQNLLLEELEKFDGIFIATSNMVENIDEAFDRRLLFKLKFENPSTEVKEKIWKSKLDFITDEEARILAKAYDLSGGQIDNIFRKSEIDYILYGKKPNIEELLEFCKKEKLNISNQSAIGFNV